MLTNKRVVEETNQDIFESKAYYNIWLKELTESELSLIIEMMDEARELGIKEGSNAT